MLNILQRICRNYKRMSRKNYRKATTNTNKEKIEKKAVGVSTWLFGYGVLEKGKVSCRDLQ